MHDFYTASFCHNACSTSFRATSVRAVTVLASALQHCAAAKTTETGQTHRLGQRLFFWLTTHKGRSQKAGDSHEALLRVRPCLSHKCDALRGERGPRTRGQAYRVGFVETGPQRKSIEGGLTSDLKPSSVVVLPSCSSPSSAAVQCGSVSNLVGRAWIQGYHLDS